jgi:addiction module HigA family antidote
MHNPSHPGEFIRGIYIKPFNISVRKVAEKLKVSPSTFSRLLNGESHITPEMALRLSKTLGRSPASWLAMQDNYNLWHAKKKVNLKSEQRLDLSVAYHRTETSRQELGPLQSLACNRPFRFCRNLQSPTASFPTFVIGNPGWLFL